MELLNSLDLDESDFEITVLPPDAIEVTDDDERDKDEVNTVESTENDVSGYLEVRTGDSFMPEQSFSISTTKNRKRLKDISHRG
ncbi:hypothetical protein TNCV_2674741 [Trichonephila clavipes]|nr:hypothetical protein TNCV_2674741 [Trichonephila clavipes]